MYNKAQCDKYEDIVKGFAETLFKQECNFKNYCTFQNDMLSVHNKIWADKTLDNLERCYLSGVLIGINESVDIWVKMKEGE